MICDLNTRQSFSNYLPIVFHNRSTYDAHFVTELLKPKKIEMSNLIFAKTVAKCASITYGRLSHISFMN